MIDHQLLRVEYAEGQLCLFVGAGVSMGCGLPDWKGLAKAVVNSFPRKPGGPPLGARSAARSLGLPQPEDPNALFDYIPRALVEEDPLLSMRYARSEFGAELRELVSQVLYRQAIALSDAVLEIPLLEKVRRICCYNYDDVLERAFAQRDRAHLSLFEDDRMPLEDERVLVLHPHGFLPDGKRPSYKATERIVLSEDDYHSLYGDGYAWANLAQLTLLLNYTALFIGCSLLDPNVRRLLDIAARRRPGHRHYALFRDRLNQDDAPWFAKNDSTAFRRVQTRLFDGLGVQPIWIYDYSEIPTILRGLRA